jgi:hypothetical protein
LLARQPAAFIKIPDAGDMQTGNVDHQIVRVIALEWVGIDHAEYDVAVETKYVTVNVQTRQVVIRGRGAGLPGNRLTRNAGCIDAAEIEPE